MSALQDPATARLLAQIHEKRAAELRGLTCALGPEKAALVVRLLALRRAGVIGAIWMRDHGCGVRVGLPRRWDAVTPTIMWERLGRWIERMEKNAASVY